MLRQVCTCSCSRDELLFIVLHSETVKMCGIRAVTGHAVGLVMKRTVVVHHDVLQILL